MSLAMKKLDKGLQTFLRYFCTAIFIVLALILITNVVLRVTNDLVIWLDMKNLKSLSNAIGAIRDLVPIKSMHWFDEIVELCFAYLVFYGAASLWGTKGHFCVGDWISKRLPSPVLQTIYRILITLISVVFLAVSCWYSYRLTVRTSELSTVFQIHKGVMYSCMPISFFIMLCYSLSDLYLEFTALVFPSAASADSCDRDFKSL